MTPRVLDFIFVPVFHQDTPLNSRNLSFLLQFTSTVVFSLWQDTIDTAVIGAACIVSQFSGVLPNLSSSTARGLLYRQRIEGKPHSIRWRYQQSGAQTTSGMKPHSLGPIPERSVHLQRESLSLCLCLSVSLSPICPLIVSICPCVRCSALSLYFGYAKTMGESEGERQCYARPCVPGGVCECITCDWVSG